MFPISSTSNLHRPYLRQTMLRRPPNPYQILGFERIISCHVRSFRLQLHLAWLLFSGCVWRWVRGRRSLHESHDPPKQNQNATQAAFDARRDDDLGHTRKRQMRRRSRRCRRSWQKRIWSLFPSFLGHATYTTSTFSPKPDIDRLSVLSAAHVNQRQLAYLLSAAQGLLNPSLRAL